MRNVNYYRRFIHALLHKKVLENVLEMLQKFYIPVFLREGGQNYLLESLQGF